jgi:hypothetical protein
MCIIFLLVIHSGPPIAEAGQFVFQAYVYVVTDID